MDGNGDIIGVARVGDVDGVVDVDDVQSAGDSAGVHDVGGEDGARTCMMLVNQQDRGDVGWVRMSCG